MKKHLLLFAMAIVGLLPLKAASYTLPFTFEATEQTFAECTTLDENHDANSDGNGGWKFEGYPKTAFKYTYSVSNQANDWLILPAVNFGDSRCVKVSFQIETYSDKEDFQVMFGHTPTVDGMTQTVLTEKDFTKTKFGELSAVVELPDDGNTEWYLGFHVTSPAFRGWVYIKDISIEASEPVVTPARPAAPVVKSESITDLDYSAVVTMPTLDNKGQALVGTMDLQVAVDGTTVKTISECAPGADVDLSLTLEAGTHTLSFMAVSDGVEGEMVSTTVEAKEHVIVPAAPVIAGVTMNFLNVNASVTMPSLDTENNAITGSLKLLCKVDGTVVRTLSWLSAGETVQFDYTLTAGQHVIGFVASLAGQESDEVTTTVEAKEQLLTLPFEMFASAETFAQCVKVDVNNDGSTYGQNGKWCYESSSFVYTYSDKYKADDWLILPMVDFGASRKVKVSLSVKTGGYPEAFEVKLGDARKVSAMTIPVMTKDGYKNDGDYEVLTTTVEIPADAATSLCLGIHATSEADNYVIKISDIKIEDADVPEITPAEPVIKQSSIENLSYSATVTMPAVDTDGNELTSNMTLEVLLDNEVAETKTDCEPGSDIDIALTLEAGSHKIGYRAVLGEFTGATVSEDVTATAIVAGNLPFTLVASEESFAQCEVIDLDGSVDNYGNIMGEWSFASNYGFKYTYNPNSDADDWLILPAVDFGLSTKVKVSVDVMTEYDTESFEIYLGRERTVEGMTLPVMSKSGFVSKNEWTTLTAIVELPQEQAQALADEAVNEYALGIHAVSPKNHYLMYFNNIRIESLATTSGVEDITADPSSEPEYYNLQGVKVDKPGHGIYIMRRGNTAVKVKI